MPGIRPPELPIEVWRMIHTLYADGMTQRQIAAKLKMPTSTVAKYIVAGPPGLDAEEKKRTIGLPTAVVRQYVPFEIDTPGKWLVIGDLHLPNHHETTIQLAMSAAKRGKYAGILLNGDVLDSHEISDHDKDPTAARYVEEIELGKQLFEWLRKQFPKLRIVYKIGNHEERLDKYIIRRAPAIWGLEGIDIRSLLHLDDYGVEFVTDKRVVRLGRLNVIHGHEYKGGITSAVNPARGIYLKARSVVMTNHWHRSSEHHERDIRGSSEAAWSLGCACDLMPKWLPLNNWNLGFATVEIGQQGHFEVTNRRVLNGEVV